MTQQNTHKSELWQRIRAARHHADLTQGVVAKAMNLSRPAVSLWESIDPKIRTRPTAQQMVQLAVLCKVAPAWLMDDASDVNHVIAYNSPANMPEAVDPIRAKATAFWHAVRYAVIADHPELANSFEYRIPGTVGELVAPFYHNKVLIAFSYDDGSRSAKEQDEMLFRQAADLLLIELMIGMKCRKTVAVWTRTGRYESSIAQELERRGFTFQPVNEIMRAAALVVESLTG